jgi:hypothetical protein
MQKFLIALLTPIIEKVFKKAIHFVMNEFKEVQQVRKDRKFLKELRKEGDARERARHIKRYIDSN